MCLYVFHAREKVEEIYVEGGLGFIK